MIFKSNNSLLALDKSALGNLHDFYYLDFYPSLVGNWQRPKSIPTKWSDQRTSNYFGFSLKK